MSHRPRALLSSSRLAALAVAIVLLATVGAMPLPHGDLKSSAPADKERLASIPKELRLTFTEPPELALTKIRLLGPGGAGVALGPLRVAPRDKATILAAITGPLTAGAYTVEWEITGDDGHPVDGRFGFVIVPGAVGTATTSPDARGVPPAPTGGDTGGMGSMVHHDTISMPQSATRFDAESAGYIAVRFFLYAALLVVIGAVVFRGAVLSLAERRADVDGGFLVDGASRAASLGRTAAILLLLAVIARLLAQSIALNGSEAMFDFNRLGTLVGGTRWGRGWLVQIAATVMALVGFTMARRDASSARTGWLLAGLSALVLAFTPAFASHAAAVQRLRGPAMLADGVHVLGAAGWLGSLLVVLAAGMPAAFTLTEEKRGRAISDLFNAFSPTALVFAGLVALTGLFAAWLHLGGFAPLWEAKYGKLLLAKLAVLSIVALTGAYNWLRVKPTLGTVEAGGRIQRSARVEVAVAVVVLALTAVLVATPTPMDKM